VGPDADALRTRCEIVLRRGQELRSRLEALAQEMAEHAEEQDLTSEELSGAQAAVAGSLFGLLGGTPGIGLGAGIGAHLFGGSPTPVGIDSSMLTGALHYSTPSHDGGGATRPEHGTSDRKVPEDHVYSSPQGEQTHSAGEDNGQTTVTAEDAEGNKVTGTFGDDGSVSLAAKDSLLKTETPLPGGGKITTETAQTYTLTENADGTVTYAFDQSHSVKGKGEAGPVSGEAEAVGTTTLEVTLPKGSTLADALAVNPHDPDTIPPGGSVTAEVSAAGSGELGVSGTKGVWEYITVGGGVEAEVGHTTVYAKDENGAMSIASGPKEAFSSSLFSQIGTDDWHLRFENGSGSTTTELEYVEFSADAAGADAYRDVASGGGMPDRIDGVVTDRYTETRNLDIGESSASAQLGKVGVERSSTDFAIEHISREWPDGHEEFVEYAAPRLNESGTFAEVVGGSGRETSYRVSLQDDGFAFMNYDESFRDAYGGREARNDGVDVYYTASELEQMRAGAERRTGMTFESNEDYLQYVAGTSALSPSGGAEEALWNAYNDYNGGTYIQNDPSTGGDIPGSQESPGR
jgi:hypothetical protein